MMWQSMYLHHTVTDAISFLADNQAQRLTLCQSYLTLLLLANTFYLIFIVERNHVPLKLC